MTPSTYEYENAGATIQLAMHCAGDSREPQVRWQIGDQRGDRGYVHLDTANPVIRLQNGETARIGGRPVSEVPVPREIGETLQEECETLGTVVSASDRLTTDPAAFPAKIAGFDRVGWEADRHVMWYCRGDRSSPRAYQIERGELVFRAQEWANGIMSKLELVNKYGLEELPS